MASCLDNLEDSVCVCSRYVRGRGEGEGDGSVFVRTIFSALPSGDFRPLLKLTEYFALRVLFDDINKCLP